MPPSPVFHSIEQYLYYFATIKRHSNLVHSIPSPTPQKPLQETTPPQKPLQETTPPQKPLQGTTPPQETTPLQEPLQEPQSRSVKETIESIPVVVPEAPSEEPIIVNVDVELVSDSTTILTFSWSDGIVKQVELVASSDLNSRVENVEKKLQEHEASLASVMKTLSEIGLRVNKIEQLV